MAQVKGDRELVQKLQSLKKTTAKKAIRKGSRAGCKVVQPIARANAPVKSGKLAAAVKVRALPRSRKWTGTQVSTKVGPEGVFYGAFIEYGTKSKSGRQKIAARHFITNAFKQAKSSAGSAFVDGIKQTIQQEVK